MLSASHRLHTDALTPEQNRAVFGKCNNPHGHGHNYVLEVLVSGQIASDTGMVINLADLDKTVRTTILDRFDHTNLNDDPLFASSVPTTENFCRTVFRLLKPEFTDSELHSVRVEETENNFFQCYDGGTEDRTR